MTEAQMQRFLEISLALSAERDREALLSAILDTAMDAARCDAGTLYLLEAGGLRFVRMVTRSRNVRQGGHDGPITLPPVPLEPAYVCAWSALHGAAIRVDDVRTETRFDFSGSLRYDEMTGYRTHSMLVVPMTDDRGAVIGVTQLINALDDGGDTVPFDPSLEQLIGALSSQAAISITNMQYAEQVRDLLDSLVAALSAAIDERTPYNANHTRNMVRYASAFLDWLDRRDHPLRYDADRRRSFLLAVWLHDVGKLVVPLEVMDKQTRLGARLAPVLDRFARIGLLDRIAFLEGRIDGAEYKARQARLSEAEALVRRADGAGFLPDADAAAVEALAAETYTETDGTARPFLTEEEHACLAVRRGTLTEAERRVMESHAAVTARILSHVSFPKAYADVPRWAAAHHEHLNGKGYPDRLTAPDIPPEVRLLTILDVFEALTARDRPYKPPMPPERALSILHDMANGGEVDGALLDLFEESRAWET